MIIICFIIGYISYYYIHRKSIKYHGPDSRDIVGKIFEYNGKYYTYKPEICIKPII
jgi:hypothetical protein